MPYKKILVPVDFSDYSDRAIEYGLFLAENFNSEVTLLHIIIFMQTTYGGQGLFDEFEETLQARENEYKERLLKKVEQAKTNGLKIKAKVLRNASAANSILEFAEQHGFNLIVIGTHGLTGFKRWIYGSVAEKVVRLSKIPVVTIHNLSKRHLIKKILIPVDFSNFAKRAVKRGVEIGKIFKARLEFLYVFDYDFHPSFYPFGLESVFKYDENQRIRSFEHMVKFTGIPEKEANYTVIEGKSYKEIQKYAQENNIDLIIMATRGLGELEHFLVGSTAERVIATAHCPVLTVRRR